jgi:hypothetical protein
VRASRFVPLAFAIALPFCGSGDAHARYEGNLNVFAGRNWMSTGDWAPLDQPSELGLMLAFGEERAAVHFALEVFHSRDEVPGGTPVYDALLKASTTEFGIRKVWMGHATHPHLGAGADVVEAQQDRNGTSGPVSYNDRGYGVWVDGGVTWRLAGHLNLGIEARYSLVRVDLGTFSVPRDTSAGGIHLGALIGYGW